MLYWNTDSAQFTGTSNADQRRLITQIWRAPMRQIFISHNASMDGETAKRLRESLIHYSIADRVFLSSDGDTPHGGSSWREWIITAIANSDMMIFVAGEASLTPWCSAELGIGRALGKPILPLRTSPDIDVNPVVDDLEAIPIDQPIQELARTIERRIGPTEWSPPIGPATHPYPGLEPLVEDQEAFLFGRSVEIRRLLASLTGSNQPQAVILSGPSGSGKSSLVRAGLLPHLRRLGWTIEGPLQPRQIDVELQSGYLKERDRVTLPVQQRVVIVDQAEELASLEDQSQDRVADWLRRELEFGRRLVVAVRSEFRPILDSVIAESREHYLPVLRTEALEEVIRGPARLVNLRLEEGLVKRLVQQTGSGAALPLLALTLQQLWKDRDAENYQLTIASLDALGGVQGVMRGLAAAAVDDAARGDPEVADRVLTLLSMLADPDQVPATRSPIRVSTLTEEERGWLEPLVDAGLIAYRTSFAQGDRVDRGQRPTGTHLADVTHESLFEWEPLAGSISTNRAKNAERALIERSADEWHRGGCVDKTLLVTGDRLSFALEQFENSANQNLLDFLRASRRQDRDRRLRRVLVSAVGVLAVVAALGAAYAWSLRNEAEAGRREAARQRDIAVAAEQRANEAEEEARGAEVDARALRAVAQSSALMATERDLAMLAAVGSYRIVPNVDSEAAVFNALAAPLGPTNYYSAPGMRWDTLVMFDSGHGIMLDDGGRPHIVDLGDGSSSPIAQGARLYDVILTELIPILNSPLVAFIGRSDGGNWTLGVWDPTTGDVRRVDHPAEIRDMATSPGRVVFGDFEGGVFVLELDDDLALATSIASLSRPVFNVDISSDGRYVAAASADGISIVESNGSGWSEPVRLEDATPGERSREVVAFRKGGDDEATELVAAGTDPLVRRWTILAGGLAGMIETDDLGRHPGTVKAIVSAPDSSTLFTAGIGGIQRWDLETGGLIGDPLTHHTSDVQSLSAWSETNVVSNDTTTALHWDLNRTRTVERDGVVPDEWLSESIVSLVQGAGPLAVVTNDGRVLVDDGRVLPAPQGVWRTWWVGASEQNATVVFEQRDLRRMVGGVNLLGMRDGGVEGLATGADAVDVGPCLAAVAAGSSISFLDVGGCGQSPDPLDISPYPSGAVEVALSEDERALVVALGEDAIVAYDLTTGLESRLFTDADGGSETTAIITRISWLTPDRVVVGRDRGDASQLLTADGTALDLPWHDDAVRWIATDQTRGRLFMGGEDGTITQTSLNPQPRLMTTFSAQKRAAINDETATVRGLRYLEGESLLISLQGFRVTAWELNPESLIGEICRRVGRDISDQERFRLDINPETTICPRDLS